MDVDGSYELHYSIRREELWKYYQWAWSQRDGLWIYWMLAIPLALFAAWALALAGVFENLAFTGTIIYIAGACFFVVFPQLAYKPQERKLVVGADGVDTSIGTRSAHRAWPDISGVISHDDCIFLVVAYGVRFMPGLWFRTRVGNAFVIPNRAFSSQEQRQAFLTGAQVWQETHRVKLPAFSPNRYFG